MKPTRFLYFASRLATHRFTGIDLILTRECNLSCRYCGVIHGEKRELLSTAQWKRIIAYFRRHGHLHFIFTGGEPLLYPGLAELIADSSRRSLTCLMSNGKALSEEVLRELKGLDFLTLSLDPELEDADSLKHGFGRLDLLKAHAARTGLSVSVMATVTRRNVDHIAGLARRMRPYGFPLLLSIYHYGETSRFDFRSSRAELDFTAPEDLAALGRMAEDLIRLRREGCLIGETDWYLRALVPFKSGQAPTVCRAGEDWFEVDSDGRVKACHDGPPSDLNALDEPDYETLKRVLKGTRPEGCRCIYDFYYNANYLRTRPISYLYEVWRRRPMLTW